VQSTTEAKYVAGVLATNEAIGVIACWLNLVNLNMNQ
jgi:hypothetical protein